MPRMRRLLWAFSIMAVMATGASAEENPRAWGLSPYVGLHHPDLENLNNGQFRSPYEGTADIIDDLGFNTPTGFTYRNPMPELEPGTLAGLEFLWNINDKHVLLIGGGSWESTSFATAEGMFPVQGALESAVSQRKGDLSYNEFYLGWRYNAIRKPKKYNLYLRLSAHEVFDIDYREDFSLLFLSGPPRSFRKSLVVQAQATGLLLLQGGGGGEWFINDWLSLGAEAGYTFGMKEMTLGDGRVSTDFRSTDNLFLQVPIVPGNDGRMQYKVESGGEYRQLRLNFDGWKALLKITLYY